MFSLCIPTMDRYDNFLSKYLPCYLDNNLIDEIIITDENGRDIEKIKKVFSNNDKLILHQNEYKLGPFLNKLKACSYAKNEWIALIDSDNFADKKYFIIAKEYIENNNIKEKNIILAPCYAKPNFNFEYLSGSIYKKGNKCSNETCMNAGNYIINKYLLDNIDLSNESENIKQSSACDVIYMNTLFFEQLDLNMHIVNNLEYDHVVHKESIYLQTVDHFRSFNEYVHNRYYKLL